MPDRRTDVTIVGLGPGDAGSLTIEARRILRRAPEVWLRTKRHPLPRWLQTSAKAHSFDDVYEQAASFVEVYATIARRVIELAARPEGVVYAVPGHPLVGEQSVRLILAAADAEGLSARLVPGLSFVEPVLAALRIDPLDAGLQVIDGAGLALSEAGSDDNWPSGLAGEFVIASRPALVCQIYDKLVAARLKLALLQRYPAEHLVTLVRGAGMGGNQHLATFPLFQLDRQRRIDHLTCLYVPALPLLDDRRSFETFRHIVARLRAPGGCPWDREQTHESLKPYLVEECYEALEALDDADLGQLEEELGDVLLQVVLHAQLAAEAGDFGMGDVLAHVSSKLIRRHPHVFGDVVVRDSGEVLRNWERIKHAEKGHAEGAESSMLGAVPREMPALAQARSIQRRAAGLGFDWLNSTQALAKVSEEAAELHRARGEERRAELGDLLFALVSAGRHMDVDAEEALRLANRRFVQRFHKMEALARQRDVSLKALTVPQLEQLWREAKVQQED